MRKRKAHERLSDGAAIVERAARASRGAIVGQRVRVAPRPEGSAAHARRRLRALASLTVALTAMVAACDLSAPSAIDMSCASADECPSGEICVASDGGPPPGSCQFACKQNSDCPAHSVCNLGALACLPSEPNPDASTEAGSSTADANPDVDATLADVVLGTESADADAASASLDEADVEAAPPKDAPDEGPGTGTQFVCDGGSRPSTLVLFGGQDINGTVLNDTWVWDGGAWSNSIADDAGSADGSSSPAGRINAVMSTACGYAVLAGGSASNAADAGLVDTWLWNGASWQSAPSQPTSVFVNAAAATSGATMYVFGGTGSGGTLNGPNLYTWSTGNWSFVSEPSANSPTARTGASMASVPGGVLLFGGFDGTYYLADTWSLMGAGWAFDSDGGSISGEIARAYAAMASLNDGRVVVFGGLNPVVGIAGDTLIWNGTWTDIGQQQTDPPARFFATMATLNGKIVLFGGLGSDGVTPLGDTWIWDGTWTAGPDAGPTARTNAAMTAY